MQKNWNCHRNHCSALLLSALSLSLMESAGLLQWKLPQNLHLPLYQTTEQLLQFLLFSFPSHLFFYLVHPECCCNTAGCFHYKRRRYIVHPAGCPPKFRHPASFPPKRNYYTVRSAGPDNGILDFFHLRTQYRIPLCKDRSARLSRRENITALCITEHAGLPMNLSRTGGTRMR